MEKRTTLTNKTIEQTYVDHLFTKEGEDQTTAHYFEGVDPNEASRIKNVVDKYKEQEVIIDKLRGEINDSVQWPKDATETTSITNGETSFKFKEHKKSSTPRYLGNLVKKIGALSVFATLFGNKSPDNDLQALPTPKNEKKNIKKEFVKEGTFDQNITPEELEARKKTVEEYLLDSSDMEYYKIENIDEDYENFRLRTLELIKDYQKEIDSLMQINSPSKSVKRHIQNLRSSYRVR